ncbi:MAG: hypothetical protein QW666_01490 [Candidatus Woesearchaeota archaeon]
MNAEQTTDEEIRKLRSVLFPAIGIQIITGFNLYPTSDASSDDAQEITISYLHEDLLEEKLHYLQIKRMLEKYCDQVKTQRLEHDVINRFSSYRLDEGWRAEQYLLVDQTPVKEEEVDDMIKQSITVIGCGKQNELIIKCEQDALNHILEQFRVYANKHEIDRETGRFVYISGTNAKKQNLNPTWTNAWEIPTIIVNARGLNEIKTYEKVRKVTFSLCSGLVSLILGDKLYNAYKEEETATWGIPSFKDYLALKNLKPDDIDNNYFANHIFFDWINRINWEYVVKTKELHGNLLKDVF